MTDEPQDKTYEATFNLVMPSNQKATTYTIDVCAGDPVEAMARAIEAWKIAVEPADVRVQIKRGKE
jgi:hypothetical protein